MLISEPKTIIDALRPIDYFNCYIGMGLFQRSNRSAILHYLLIIYTAIITLLNWITIYLVFDGVARFFHLMNGSPMILAMYRVLIFTSCCIVVNAPFLVWLRKEGICDCLQRMPVLDVTFETEFGARNEYKSLYIRLTCQVIAMTLVMCAVSISDTLAKLDVLLQLEYESLIRIGSITYIMHHAILVMLLLDVNFSTFVGYLDKKFRDVNQFLLRLSEQPAGSGPDKKLFMVSPKVGIITPGNIVKNTKPKNGTNDNRYLVREIRKAHLELCKLSRKINLAFGIQNLLSMGISFVMITGMLYGIYNALTRGTLTSDKLAEVISAVVWTTIYTFKIWMISHSCWSVSNEAEKTGEVVYELLNLRVDDELQIEIREFAVQMLQNPVRFNACGFFTLDYTFVQGVIGSITTYLVILIQMSQLSEPIVSNSSANQTGF